MRSQAHTPREPLPIRRGSKFIWEEWIMQVTRVRKIGGSDVAGPRRLTYSVEEVAEVLGLSRSKTYELVARGEIPVVPLSGRRRLIARATVDRLLGAAEGR